MRDFLTSSHVRVSHIKLVCATVSSWSYIFKKNFSPQIPQTPYSKTTTDRLSAIAALISISQRQVHLQRKVEGHEKGDKILG